MLERDEGECVVFGRDFKNMNHREQALFRGQNIGFVFQMFNLITNLVGGRKYCCAIADQRSKTTRCAGAGAEVLSPVGMGDRTRSLPSELSGGQQQRVAIARAIVHNPKFIVCDEPTSALDHETGHKVMELLHDVVVGVDRALVVVTHDSRIFEFAHRIARMDDGHIISISDSQDF